MTFQEFLIIVRYEIGFYCKDSYWYAVYESLPEKTEEYFRKNMAFYAINAIGTDYVYRHG